MRRRSMYKGSNSDIVLNPEDVILYQNYDNGILDGWKSGGICERNFTRDINFDSVSPFIGDRSLVTTTKNSGVRLYASDLYSRGDGVNDFAFSCFKWIKWDGGSLDTPAIMYHGIFGSISTPQYSAFYKDGAGGLGRVGALILELRDEANNSTVYFETVLDFTPTANVWFNLGVTYNGNDTCYFYVDGVRYSTTLKGDTGTYVAMNSVDSRVYSFNSVRDDRGSRAWTGNQDEFIFINKEVNNNEATAIYNKGVNGEALFPDYSVFNKLISYVSAEDSAIKDSSLNFNFRQRGGSNLVVRDTNIKKVGTASNYSQNRSNEAIEVSASNLSEFSIFDIRKYTDKWSAGCWVYRNTSNSNIFMCYGSASNSRLFQIGWTSAFGSYYAIVWKDNNNRRTYFNSVDTPVQSWVHVCLVVNSVSDIRFYINNVLVDSFSDTGTFDALQPNPTPNYSLNGNTFTSAVNFDGYQDENFFYNYAIDDTLRNEIYNNGVNALPIPIS